MGRWAGSCGGTINTFLCSSHTQQRLKIRYTLITPILLPLYHHHQPSPMHLEVHRGVKCSEMLYLLMGNEVCACINMSMLVLLSSATPPFRKKPSLTSGSIQPATTDHTCVPSATHAHTQNLTLIVSNVRTPLCGGKRVSKTIRAA